MDIFSRRTGIETILHIRIVRILIFVLMDLHKRQKAEVNVTHIIMSSFMAIFIQVFPR